MPPIAAPPPAARSMSTRAEALCGTAAAEPQPLRFSTGPLAFELVGGNVHAVRIGGVEILRAIQYLKIGRAHVCTPVTNAHLVCRLLLEKKNIMKIDTRNITIGKLTAPK